jgi:mannitol-1-phosphate 5-dehydrogenase
MGLNGKLTLAGFGFGPIQAGLFVLEAFRSGNFRRVVVGEVLPDSVRSVREEGGKFRLNIAQRDGIESVTLGPVELEDPAVPGDRERFIEAIQEASEIATAVPSVRFYKSDAPGSIHRLLAAGLSRRGGRPVVIYTAENHNRAAEILEEAVLAELSPSDRDRVRAGTRFLNTVIGKMSAVIADPDRMSERGLSTLTPRDPRAFLVESFNRILISPIRFPSGVSFRRGIEVFEEKNDLLPFEEAKLYGHNAAHALAAYLAAQRDLLQLEQIRKVPGLVDFVRAALLEEAGEALLRKWKGVDRLFSPARFRGHADDLLERMLNPYLGDLVERIARDPERKLGWEDRLIGTMRLVLSQGLRPWRFAVGAAAALAYHEPDVLRANDAQGTKTWDAWLEGIWRSSSPDPVEKAQVLGLVRDALLQLRDWRAGGALPSG